MLSDRYPTTGGAFIMDVAVSFLVTVMGGVVCHYIIKWLDRDDKGDR